MSFPELIVQFALLGMAGYVLVGMIVTAYLHAGRLVRIDPAAKGAGILFRILITPGLIALWPLMLRRARRSFPPGTEVFLTARKLRTAHRLLIQLLALALPILVALAILSRPRAVTNPTALPIELRQQLPGGSK